VPSAPSLWQAANGQSLMMSFPGIPLSKFDGSEPWFRHRRRGDKQTKSRGFVTERPCTKVGFAGTFLVQERHRIRHSGWDVLQKETKSLVRLMPRQIGKLFQGLR
jgi:hypothetical protein